VNDEHKQPKNLDKVVEGHEPRDNPLKIETINSKIDNARQEKLKLLDAVRSYKLTGEGQMSFKIQGMLDGEEIDVKDKRRPRSSIADSVGTLIDTKYDARNRPIEKTSDHRGQEVNHPDEDTRKQIERKEHELHDKYGVTFSKPGEDLGPQVSLTGKHGKEVHARCPTMLELNAIEKSLEKSDPAYKTPDGNAVKFCFADKQFHNGNLAQAQTATHDSGAVEISIFPEGVADAHGRVRPLENCVIHELAHNTLFKKDKMGDVMPSGITSQIGFYEVPENPERPRIGRDQHGNLWRHFLQNTDSAHWWTKVNADGTAVTTDGKRGLRTNTLMLLIVLFALLFCAQQTAVMASSKKSAVNKKQWDWTQGWHGIVPGKATLSDVEKRFGPGKLIKFVGGDKFYKFPKGVMMKIGAVSSKVETITVTNEACPDAQFPSDRKEAVAKYRYGGMDMLGVITTFSDEAEPHLAELEFGEVQIVQDTPFEQCHLPHRAEK
jgi:hypothetical protein